MHASFSEKKKFKRTSHVDRTLYPYKMKIYCTPKDLLESILLRFVRHCGGFNLFPELKHLPWDDVLHLILNVLKVFVLPFSGDSNQ